MRFAVIALMALVMSGCGDNSGLWNLGLGPFGEEGKIQEAVRESLKDPDSAKFGELTQVSDRRACQTVNSKNGLGGYAGDQQAYLLKSDGKWEVIYIEDKLGHQGCIRIMSDRK